MAHDSLFSIAIEGYKLKDLFSGTGLYEIGYAVSRKSDMWWDRSCVMTFHLDVRAFGYHCYL